MTDLTIFDNIKPDGDKLLASGFAYDKDAGTYTAQVPVSGGDFTFIIRISPDGVISTEVMDAEANAPYLPYRVKDAAGAFTGSINEECQKIAQCIADKCFSKPGLGDQLDQICAYIRSKYGAELEYLWEKYPDTAVWRRPDTGKWFGIIMEVQAAKLGINSQREMLCMNVHVPEDIASSADRKTVFPAYHMNKKHWITLILDGRMPIEDIREMIDISYSLAAK
ncbi:MAG: MmcQ/YjbR family DNA-binding protein [Clostridia bacterium]|nr:MmcQ/YjbR family DNA-binding protein [Clostridia bacterium]